MQKILLTLIVLLLLNGIVQAKEKPDTSYLPETYYDAFKNDLPIFSGRLFQGYASKIKGTPYIPSSGWESGSILYDNIWYKASSLKFDAHTGDLIVQTPFHFSVIPPNHNIHAFLIRSKKFIRVDSIAKGTSAFFYEILEEGDVTLLARRNAIMDQRIEQLTLEYEFIRTDEFFVRTPNRITKINSRSDLYEVLKDKRKIIKKALKTLGLNFRKNREAVIRRAVETYNTN